MGNYKAGGGLTLKIIDDIVLILQVVVQGPAKKCQEQFSIASARTDAELKKETK